MNLSSHTLAHDHIAAGRETHALYADTKCVAFQNLRIGEFKKCDRTCSHSFRARISADIRVTKYIRTKCTHYHQGLRNESSDMDLERPDAPQRSIDSQRAHSSFQLRSMSSSAAVNGQVCMTHQSKYDKGTNCKVHERVLMTQGC